MRRRRGSLLIVVLVVVMMISLAAYHFTMSMEAEHLAVSHAGDQIAGRHCALSGVEVMAAILEQPRRERYQLGMIADDPIDLWPAEDQATISPYRVLVSLTGSRPAGDSAQGQPGYGGSFAGIDTSVRPHDESAKLNLRRLLTWDQTQPGIAHEALLRLPGMDDITADRLLDWIDPDSEPRSQGDEQDARNAFPIIVDELAFLAAPSAQDRLGISQPNEVAQPGRPPWLDYLTLHSAERNEAFDGQPRTFVNDSDLVRLHRSIHESLSKEIADYVVLYRQYGPAERDLAVPSNPMVDPAIDFSVAASVQITDLSQLVDSVVELPATGSGETEESADPPTLVPSPIASTPQGQNRFSIGESLDRLTVVKQRRLVGRINVLTAPVEVLAAVPGLGDELAERIVSQRQNAAESFRHPLELLSSLSVESTIVKQILPHLTVYGDVVRFQAIGSVTWGSHQQVSASPTAYRCDVMLDASDGRARQIWFRRLRATDGRASFDSHQESQLPAPGRGPSEYTTYLP